AQPGFVTCTACRFRWKFRKSTHCWACGQSLELKPANPSPRNGVWAGKGAGGATPKASPKAKAAVAGGSPKAKAAAAGGAVDGRRGFPAAPWSSSGSSELDKLLAISDPTMTDKLPEALAEARDFVPPPPAEAQKTLEQQLQSATDRRINLQRQLDEAAGALVAAGEQLDECRGWRDTVATSLAEAQAEEAQLLRSRAQASGIAQPTPDASKSVTFDVETLENFSELEEEAQGNPRQMCEGGHRVMLEAQAVFERKCGPASGSSGRDAQAAELGAAAAEAARLRATEQMVASAPAAPAAGDGAAGQFAG
ncbi:unnamed protein product, partial [Prorocentrum cordatum]